jgi:phosphoribosylformylglycinamidine (FGAM) synthase PurS component
VRHPHAETVEEALATLVETIFQVRIWVITELEVDPQTGI